MNGIEKSISMHLVRLKQARLDNNMFIVRESIASIERLKAKIRHGEPAHFFVEYLGPSTNSIYAGLHWTKRKRDKAEALAAVKASELPTKPFDGLVDLTFTPTLGKGARRRDTSNGSYSAKMLEDALVEYGVLQDDTGEFVRNVTLTPAVVDRKQPSGTWINITPISEEK